jgi:hypothetical protein
MSAAQRVIHELNKELMQANQDAHECRIAFQEMRAALKESQAIVREQAARLQMAEHAVAWELDRRNAA